MKKVAVIMGSDSDLPVVEKAIDTLRDFGVPMEIHVCSAHRTPEEASRFARNAAAEVGFFLVMAGGSCSSLWWLLLLWSLNSKPCRLQWLRCPT